MEEKNLDKIDEEIKRLYEESKRSYNSLYRFSEKLILKEAIPYASKLLLDSLRGSIDEDKFLALEQLVAHDNLMAYRFLEKLKKGELKEDIFQEYMHSYYRLSLHDENPLNFSNRLPSKEEIFRAINKLSLEKKLVVLNYLQLRFCKDTKNSITLGCHKNNFSIKSYISFKHPSGCYSCFETKENISKLGLLDQFKFKGDREYCLEYSFFEVFKKALQEDNIDISQSMLPEFEKNLEEYHKISKEIEVLNSDRKLFQLLLDSGYELEKIRSQMRENPDFFKNLISIIYSYKGFSGIKKVKFDPSLETVVVLSDHTLPFQGSGCQYSSRVTVYTREGQKNREFVYRHHHDPSLDRPEFNFADMDVTFREGDVHVGLRDSKGESLEFLSFDLPKAKPVEGGDGNFDEFLKVYEDKKRQLLQRHTRKGEMPAYHFQEFYAPGRTMDVIRETVPYSQARILEEEINPLSKEAILTIGAQIDYNISNGGQFECVKYRIKSNGEEELLERDTRWSK